MTTIKGFPKKVFSRTQTYCREVPSIAKTHHFINDLINFLFPIRGEKNSSLAYFEAKWEEIQHQFKALITPLEPMLTKSIDELSVDFFSAVAGIHDTLIKDADAYV